MRVTQLLRYFSYCSGSTIKMTTPHNNENKLSQQGSMAEHTLPPPSGLYPQPTSFPHCLPPPEASLAAAPRAVLWAMRRMEERHTGVRTQETHVLWAERKMEERRTVVRTHFPGISHDSATCPICERTFYKGWYHPADQKLYHHMGRGKGHRSLRNGMEWSRWLN